MINDKITYATNCLISGCGFRYSTIRNVLDPPLLAMAVSSLRVLLLVLILLGGSLWVEGEQYYQ